MVYVIAIILGVSLAYVSFMAGSYHGYGKALEDMENVEELTTRAENAIKTLNTMRKDEDSE